jgi:drug/metabolite transporter (DMT)-like permease
MSPTGVAFSYAIGLVFAVGGILFLVLLEENRFLFGIPYLLIGLIILGGVAASQRRLRRRARGEDERGRGSGSGRPTPY